LGFPLAAQAAGFTPGNIVVERVGSGGAALSSASQAVFLNEYTPTGTLVQSIALPTTASGAQQPLTESGTATTDGMLNLSPNGQFLTVSGYDTGTGTASVASSNATTINRVVGLVNAAGTVDTTTHGAFFSGNNFRGAVTTDGTSFYVAGTGTAPDKGVELLPYGGSTPTSINSTIAADAVNIYGNTLYATSTTMTATSIVQLGTTGTLPTGAVTATNLSGLPLGSSSDSPHQFVIFNEGGNQVAYIADDTGSALSKYELLAGVWTAEGKVGTGGNDYTGLTGVLSGTTVTLYATLLNGDSTAGGAAQLVSVIDTSGAGGSLTGTTVNLVATAGTNETFAGVAFAPIATPEPASVVLAALGLFALVGYGCRRRRAT
jgi:MYXO-CTERM domain-containing protein